MTTLRVVISGAVQGVGYRNWMSAQAQLLSLDGWVRNRADGTVEALVSGDGDTVRELLRACHRGPSRARVDDIAEHEAEPPATPGFHMLPTA